MENVKVSAKVKKLPNRKPLEITVALPVDLAEARRVWGDVPVFDQMMNSVIIAIQARMRGYMALGSSLRPDTKPMSDADIAAKFRDWKPGEGRKPADPVKRINAVHATLRRMTETERAAAGFAGWKDPGVTLVQARTPAAKKSEAKGNGPRVKFGPRVK